MRLQSIPKEIEMVDSLYHSVCDARMNITLASAMISYQVYKCRIYFTNDLPTAGALVTASENLIMINPDFWNNVCKNTKQKAYVLFHETCHIFQMHGARCRDNGYDHAIYNQAADYNINLTASGYYKDEQGNIEKSIRYRDYMEEPEGFPLCLDTKYIGMSSDEIYFELIKNAKEVGGQGGQGGQGGPSALDDIYFDEGESTTEQQAKNRASAVASVYHARNLKSIGANEANLEHEFLERAKPQFDYKDILQDVIISKLQDDINYNRIVSKSSGSVIFPSYTGDYINFLFGVDSSGSMSESDYRTAAGEFYGILDQFDCWRVTLVTTDTKCHVVGTFSSDDGDDFSTIPFKMIGGGGTELSPIGDYANHLIEEDECELTATIILTDGHFPVQSLDNSLPATGTNIVIVTEGGNKNVVMNNARVLFV